MIDIDNGDATSPTTRQYYNISSYISSYNIHLSYKLFLASAVPSSGLMKD